MKEFDFKGFKDYLKQNYLNLNRFPIEDSPNELTPCVYFFLDPWFYILDDVFYVLHTMGFQIGYGGHCFYFARVNKKVCPQLELYDKLLDFEIRATGEKTTEDREEKNLVISVVSNRGKQKTLLLKVPFYTELQSSTFYQERGEGNAYIKINDFTAVRGNELSALILGKRKLVIDLRENMGGNVNCMIATLELLHIAVASGRWCGAEWPECVSSGHPEFPY